TEAILAGRPAPCHTGAHRGIARGVSIDHWSGHHRRAHRRAKPGHADDGWFPARHRRRSCRRGHRHSASGVGDGPSVINHRLASYSLDAPGEIHPGGERMSPVAHAWHWLTDPAHSTGISGIPNRPAETATATFAALVVAAIIAIPAGLII